MVPLVILPKANVTNCAIARANGTIGFAICTNYITNGTIGKTLNDIGIPWVPLGNPEHTHCYRSGRFLHIRLCILST